MPYNAVTWTAGELVTATKMAAVEANDLYFDKRHGNILQKYHTDSGSTDAAYTLKWGGYFYLASTNILSVTCYFLMKSGGAGQAVYAKCKVDASDSYATAEQSEDTTSYVLKSPTISLVDLPNLKGWHTIGMYQHKGADTTCTTQKFSLIISPE